jgi:hypothetical protein
LDGVFDERLDEHGRDRDGSQYSRAVAGVAEAMFAAEPLDFKERGEEADLVGKRDGGLAVEVEGVAEDGVRFRTACSVRGESSAMSAREIRKVKRKWGLIWARKARSSASAARCWRASEPSRPAASWAAMPSMRAASWDW